MKSIKSFEDLAVFQKAYKVSLEIHVLSLSLPKSEQYGLADQIRRASKSICATIAEGFGKQKQSGAEYRRYLQMAMGSANEMRVWIRYCYDLRYIDESKWIEWREEYNEIAKMLQGLNQSWKDR